MYRHYLSKNAALRKCQMVSCVEIKLKTTMLLNKEKAGSIVHQPLVTQS